MTKDQEKWDEIRDIIIDIIEDTETLEWIAKQAKDTSMQKKVEEWALLMGNQAQKLYDKIKEVKE